MKKILLLFIFFCCFFLFSAQTMAVQLEHATSSGNQQANVTPEGEKTVSLYLFYGDGCPHCAQERAFFDRLLQERSDIKVYEFEVYKNKQHQELLQRVLEELDIEANGVPVLIIGDTPIVGYNEVAAKEIITRIEKCLLNQCKDTLATIIPEDQRIPKVAEIKATPHAKKSFENERNSEQVSLPFFGVVQLRSLSLPLLTIVLAFLDGFNPCAMWILLFLIGLLLGLKDAKKRWFLGSLFIASSAVVYFLFLSAWLNLFLVIGYIPTVRVVIGFAALTAGVIYLRDYRKNKSGGCAVVGNEKRQRVFHQLKEITQQKSLLLASIGMILLAVGVNLIELLCSAGLPAIYTHVLSLSNISTWQYYGYLVLYVLVFMLDDLFVFSIAMITVQSVGIQSTYARYSHLVGGILMLLIGILLIFHPESLMFG